MIYLFSIISIYIISSIASSSSSSISLCRSVEGIQSRESDYCPVW